MVATVFVGVGGGGADGNGFGGGLAPGRVHGHGRALRRLVKAHLGIVTVHETPPGSSQDCGAPTTTLPDRQRRKPMPQPRLSTAHPPPATASLIQLRPRASCRRTPAPRYPSRARASRPTRWSE